MRRHAAVTLVLSLVAAGGCVGQVSSSDPPDAGADAAAAAADAAAGDAAPRDSTIAVDGAPAAADTGVEAGPPPTDDAEIVSAPLPAALTCGEARRVTISVRNTGSTTWTSGAYRLGGAAAGDPLSSAGRVDLAAGDAVAPGGVHDFTLALLAPSAAGPVTTEWQMVHEGVGRFGGAAARAVAVDALPDGETILASATIPNSPPDVPSWPATTTITQLAVRADGVAVEFGKKDGADRWPDVTPPGWTGPLQYTLWLALKIDGAWVTSGIIQFWYGLAASGGDVTQGDQIAINWVYDARWGAMDHYQPVAGESVGFMVTAGNVRGVVDGSQSPVKERSNLVVIPFPAASGVTFTF
ncbi:MAG TPA: NBR1-Ig-like domain-containing protein [Polyangia bacterium]|jgi:hypothetical protein